MILHYRLDPKTHQPIPCTFQEWISRTKGATRVFFTSVGYVDVSTVFLGLDHAFGLSPKPVLFETVIFGGAFNHDCYRSCTYEEAHVRHVAAIQIARSDPKLRSFMQLPRERRIKLARTRRKNLAREAARAIVRDIVSATIRQFLGQAKERAKHERAFAE